MGFKEGVNVHLSTVGASELRDGMSGGRWDMKAPLRVPNHNYKIKVRVGNAVFPKSYDLFSEERGNDTLLLLYSKVGEKKTFSVERAMESGNFIKVKLPQAIHRSTPEMMVTAINNEIIRAVGRRCEEVTDSLYKPRTVPVLVYDKTSPVSLNYPDSGTMRKAKAADGGGGGGDIVLPAPDTYVSVDTIKKEDTGEGLGINDPNINTGEMDLYVKRSYFQLESGGQAGMAFDLRRYDEVAGGKGSWSWTLNSPLDNTVDHDTWYLANNSDLPILSRYGIQEKDIRLAHAVGFARYVQAPKRIIYVGYGDPGYNETYDDTLGIGEELSSDEGKTEWEGLNRVRDLLRAPRQPDFMGTRYIKVMTNLKVNNVDPNGRDFKNLLTVIPVTQSTSTVDDGLYYIGSTQQPGYMTLGQDILDRIELDLYDDHDNPIKMHADWYIELDVMYEEPEKTDAYRGYQDAITKASNRYHADPGPESYRTFYNEAGQGMNELEYLESRQRESDWSRGGGYAAPAFGGYPGPLYEAATGKRRRP